MSKGQAEALEISPNNAYDEDIENMLYNESQNYIYNGDNDNIFGTSVMDIDLKQMTMTQDQLELYMRKYITHQAYTN
ncbi:8350_t:CDS:2 [Cetraspora pellucida]|uniref:8350_t:CDS:1 n=1 Tax=Cetraspora pellucida TaxID=1433469 RepID=A0A9N9ER39_9GLOM|nr:8350_t:CDS:2 [Cetraspora pellucida]